ncbi:hypothetical protein, partial [Pseudomonas gingeri]|uniref:hypothetical protein n=1 Tax=Pseudomonas gingeri TaxID=117681 RepID=UPI001ADFA2C3
MDPSWVIRAESLGGLPAPMLGPDWGVSPSYVAHIAWTWSGVAGRNTQFAAGTGVGSWSGVAGRITQFTADTDAGSWSGVVGHNTEFVADTAAG